MKWISVNERLPTIEDMYDGEMGGNCDFCLVWDQENSASPEMALFTIDRYGQCSFELCDEDNDWFVPTHWMRIDPPEEV